MPLVSVIIPVYNAEKYIRFTLESVKRQTFQRFEVLIIDDGSTDNSASICNQYVMEDNRFKLIRKTNGGVSSARNLGIDQARGKYIYFMDSDDRVESTLLEVCLKPLEELNVDMVIFGMSFDIEKKGRVINHIIKTYSEKILCSENWKNEFIELYENNYISSMCNKIIKKELLDLYKIRYDEKITNYEDLIFSISCINRCKNIQIISSCFYHYILRDELGMSRKYKEGLSSMIPKLIRKLKCVYNECGFSEKVMSYMEVDLQRMLWLGISNICRSDMNLRDKACEIRTLCENPWIKENLSFKKNGNIFNDINLLLLSRKYWRIMVIFNHGVNVVRDIKY